jgi:hypothetical protein
MGAEPGLRLTSPPRYRRLASTVQAPGDAALAQAEIAARLDAAALLLSNALTVGDVELADAALAALALIDRARLWLRVAA